MKVHENLYNGGRAVSCGQTEKHDEANIPFSQFCERAFRSVKTSLQTVAENTTGRTLRTTEPLQREHLL
jgi:hypothetical protein